MLPANIKIRLTAHFPAEKRTSDQFPKPFKTALRVRKDNRSLKYVPKLNTAGSTFSSNSFSPLLTEINYKILESNLIQRGNEFFFCFFFDTLPPKPNPRQRERFLELSSSRRQGPSRKALQNLTALNAICRDGWNVVMARMCTESYSNKKKKERASNSFFRGS